MSAFDFKRGDVIVTTRNDYISNQLAIFRWHGVAEWKCGAPRIGRWRRGSAIGKGVLPDSHVRLLALRGCLPFGPQAAG